MENNLGVRKKVNATLIGLIIAGCFALLFLILFWVTNLDILRLKDLSHPLKTVYKNSISLLILEPHPDTWGLKRVKIKVYQEFEIFSFDRRFL